MNKFQKWFFKLLTGYEFVEYETLLKIAREIIDASQQVNEQHKETLALAKAVNDRCNRLLDRYERLNKDETMD